ncbi:unnamed protein product [Brassica rapa subsp. trilocularis]
MPPKDDNSEESVKLFLSTVSAAEMFSVRAALSWLRFCFVIKSILLNLSTNRNVTLMCFLPFEDTVSQSSAPTLPLMLTMKPLVRFMQRMT